MPFRAFISLIVLSVVSMGCGQIKTADAPPPMDGNGGGDGGGGGGGAGENGGFEKLVFISKRDDLIQGTPPAANQVYLFEKSTAELARLTPPETGQNVGYWYFSAELATNGRDVLVSRGIVNQQNDFDSSAWLMIANENRWIRTSIRSNDTVPQMAYGLGTEESAISADGRYVVFASWALDLIPGISTPTKLIYSKDLQTKEVRLLTQANAGELENPQRGGRDFAMSPRTSRLTSRLVFSSNATNMRTGPTLGEWQVYTSNFDGTNLQRVSVGSLGQNVRAHALHPDISADGKLVVFSTLSNHSVNFDFTPLGESEPTCPGGSISGMNWLCASQQIILKNLETGTLERISKRADGAAAVCGVAKTPRISPEGDAVAYVSSLANLFSNVPTTGGATCPKTKPAQIVVFDRTTGQSVRVSSIGGRGLKGPCYQPQFSPDGKEVAFLCQSSEFEDEDPREGGERESLFIYHRNSGRTRQIF